jgi:NAD(P)-dependent dehydrogenase (short-subunit alcohol dehydrogenase family)
VESAFRDAEQALGPLHITFVNAGIAGEGGSLADSALADWQRVINTDLTGTHLTVRAAARRTAPRGYGKLVTTGSLYSLRGDPLFGIHAYTAAKSGVAGLTRSAAISLGRSGVRINAIVPVYIHTQIAGGVLCAHDPGSVRSPAEDHRPCAAGEDRPAAGAEGLAVFLAAPASDYCTGGIYAVDGGWLAT